MMGARTLGRGGPHAACWAASRTCCSIQALGEGESLVQGALRAPTENLLDELVVGVAPTHSLGTLHML